MMKVNKLSLLSWKILLCLVIFYSPKFMFGQTMPDWIKTMKSGNLQYKQNDFEGAERTYLEAEKIGGDQPINEFGSKFNLGNAQYRQKKYKEGISSFESAFNSAKSNEEKANALYNKGNTEYLAEDYQSALKSYRDALKYNPKDNETINNFAKTKLKLIEEKQNKPPEDEDGKKQQDQDQNQDPNQKEKQNQDQKGQNQNQNQEEKDPQQKDGKSDDKQPNQDNQAKESQSDKGDNKDITKSGMSKEYLQRLLKMIEDEEKSIQQKLRKQNVKSSKQTKDW